MRKSFAIIHFAIHNTISHSLIPAALSILAASYLFGFFLTQLIVSGHIRVLIDYACGAYYLFILLFTFIFVINYFKRLEANHNYQWLLTSGISRKSFIMYSYCAFALIIFLIGLLFFLAAYFWIYYQTGITVFYLWPSFLIYACEGMVLIALATIFAISLSLYVAYFAFLGSYLLCLVNHSWWQTIISKDDSYSKYLQLFISYMIPDFKLLDIHAAILYEQPIDYYSFCAILIYCSFFSIAITVFARYLFKRTAL